MLQNKNSFCRMLLFNNIEIIVTDIDRAESFNYDQPDKMDMTSETHKRIINIFYDDYDGLRLLLCHANGTKYANFIHDFVDDAAKRSITFMQEVYRRGISDFLIDDEEFHMLLTAYWSTMFEPIIHGLLRCLIVTAKAMNDLSTT